MKRGLVIGKFYPPHKGHQYLMQQALTHVDELTVIVCDKSDQLIRGSLRAEWIKDFLSEAKVVVVEDVLPPDDSEAWAKLTVKVLGFVPDIVFTSEEYGPKYAAYMGCRHIFIDPERKCVPISATKVRDNPFKHWSYLPACVKAYYVKRICIIGAESTGTTTLAAGLAAEYDTVWVPEYGRYFAEKNKKHETSWRTEDFVEIATQQNKAEDALARESNKILFCDTDSFATTLWHERYMGFVSPEVDALSASREYEQYIVTDVDIPFVQDGTRDGEHIREKMHHRLLQELESRDKKYMIVSGSIEKRIEQAKAQCDKILMSAKTVPLLKVPSMKSV